MERPSEIFNREFAAYVPTPNDPLDRGRFYAAHRALTIAWPGINGCVIHCAAVSAAACTVDSDRYRTALLTALDMAERIKPPQKPYIRILWALCPAPVTDADVEKFVREGYKRFFPGKRWGTKHAREQLSKVSDQARKILEKNYKVVSGRNKREEKKIKTENATRSAEYDAEVEEIMKFKANIQELKKRE